MNPKGPDNHRPLIFVRKVHVMAYRMSPEEMLRRYGTKRTDLMLLRQVIDQYVPVSIIDSYGIAALLKDIEDMTTPVE